jgi:hypothetical protein
MSAYVNFVLRTMCGCENEGARGNWGKLDEKYSTT